MTKASNVKLMVVQSQLTRVFPLSLQGWEHKIKVQNQKATTLNWSPDLQGSLEQGKRKGYV